MGVRRGPGRGLGALLRGYRSAAGLTQEELAERSGLSIRALGDMERGRTVRPTRRSLELLADALELGEPDRARLMAARRCLGTGAGFGEPAGNHAGPFLPVPQQLPAAVRYFTGRAAELRVLDELLSQAVGGGDSLPVAAVTGTAGVGKTALAVHWARQHAAAFPDGQLYVDLGGFGPAKDPVSPAEALGGFLDALQIPTGQTPASLGARQALYRSVLAGKKILIVLDNARDPAQVRPLLPGSPGCMVVITSRSELGGLVWAQGARPVILDVLTVAEAHQLLAARLGAARLAAEPGAAAELIGLCARLPLALAITAGRAAMRPQFALAALAAELRDVCGRLSALATGEAATDLRAVFSWSYYRLSPDTARMFRLIGVHPGPDITVTAAASLAGLPRPETRRLLTELTRSHLLAEPTPGRYACHYLLRAFAAGQAAEEEACQAAVGRALDHYLHTAHAAESSVTAAGRLGCTLL